MTKFAIGVAVKTTTSSVTVDAGLQPGLHAFRLVVVDNSGNASHPSDVVIRVEPRSIVVGSTITPATSLRTATPTVSITPATPPVPKKPIAKSIAQPKRSVAPATPAPAKRTSTSSASTKRAASAKSKSRKRR